MLSVYNCSNHGQSFVTAMNFEFSTKTNDTCKKELKNIIKKFVVN
jgi:hypothetical protein